MSEPDTPRLFPAAAERPSHYPLDLPFLPHRLATVDERDGVRTVTWPALDRPLDALQLLIGASAHDGWTRAGMDSAAPGRALHFRKGPLERAIRAVQAGPFSFVTLEQWRTA